MYGCDGQLFVDATAAARAVRALPVYTDRQADLGTTVLLVIALVLTAVLVVRWWGRRGRGGTGARARRGHKGGDRHSDES